MMSKLPYSITVLRWWIPNDGDVCSTAAIFVWTWSRMCDTGLSCDQKLNWSLNLEM